MCPKSPKTLHNVTLGRDAGAAAETPAPTRAKRFSVDSASALQLGRHWACCISGLSSCCCRGGHRHLMCVGAMVQHLRVHGDRCDSETAVDTLGKADQLEPVLTTSSHHGSILHLCQVLTHFSSRSLGNSHGPFAAMQSVQVSGCTNHGDASASYSFCAEARMTLQFNCWSKNSSHRNLVSLVVRLKRLSAQTLLRPLGRLSPAV